MWRRQVEDFRLRQRVNNNEAELQALKEYIKLLEQRLERLERLMEDDGK